MLAPKHQQETGTNTGHVLQGIPSHVAIIMDGNRRWAQSQGLSRAQGHRRGLDQLIALLPCFRKSNIQTVTLFGFASANWKRKPEETRYLLHLAGQAIRRFKPLCLRENIRIEVIGRRDRIPKMLVHSIEIAECETKHGARTLRIALDYSAREHIISAAKKAQSPDDFSKLLAKSSDVDLLIRTGKEQRLSDFLLWECAFAELYFPDIYWPDFDASAFDSALQWFQQRRRNFGV